MIHIYFLINDARDCMWLLNTAPSLCASFHVEDSSSIALSLYRTPFCVGTSRISPSATPGHEHLRQEFPGSRMSCQYSSAHCPKSSDPSVPIKVNMVHASVPRGV
jgi:hypothetical protein